MRGAVVVDCSALFDLLLAGSGSDLQDLLAQSEWHAPDLIDYEFLAALRRHVELGQIPSSEATERIDLFAELNMERHSVDLLRHRVWALRHNFTVYDASYVALAAALDAPLVTTDRHLARAAVHFCSVLTP